MKNFHYIKILCLAIFTLLFVGCSSLQENKPLQFEGEPPVGSVEWHKLVDQGAKQKTKNFSAQEITEELQKAQQTIPDKETLLGVTHEEPKQKETTQQHTEPIVEKSHRECVETLSQEKKKTLTLEEQNAELLKRIELLTAKLQIAQQQNAQLTSQAEFNAEVASDLKEKNQALEQQLSQEREARFTAEKELAVVSTKLSLTTTTKQVTDIKNKANRIIKKYKGKLKQKTSELEDSKKLLKASEERLNLVVSEKDTLESSLTQASQSLDEEASKTKILHEKSQSLTKKVEELESTTKSQLAEIKQLNETHRFWMAYSIALSIMIFVFVVCSVFYLTEFSVYYLEDGLCHLLSVKMATPWKAREKIENYLRRIRSINSADDVTKEDLQHLRSIKKIKLFDIAYNDQINSNGDN